MRTAGGGRRGRARGSEKRGNWNPKPRGWGGLGRGLCRRKRARGRTEGGHAGGEGERTRALAPRAVGTGSGAVRRTRQQGPEVGELVNKEGEVVGEAAGGDGASDEVVEEKLVQLIKVSRLVREVNNGAPVAP